MSFDGVVGYSHVPAVRLPFWPTPKFFNRPSYLESLSPRRILNESNRNTANSVNGKVDRRKDNGTMTQSHLPPEMENSKVEDYLRSWQPQNKSSHMMQLLFDNRSEPETDEKPIRLTESEYRSMTAQLRDARQVVSHSKSNTVGLTPTTKNQEIYRTQSFANSPRAVRDKTTWRPYLLQPCLLQQSFNHHLIDSSGKKATDDRHHQIVITSKARLNPSRTMDPKISQTPSIETDVPRDPPTNQSSSGEEDDDPMNPRRPSGKDHDSDSTSSDDDSRFFLTEQTKSSQRTKGEAAAEERDEYRFATPLSEDVMRLDLSGMSRVERDWRTLTNVRPKTQTEARILDRLLQMERFQTQTVEVENGLRRPIRVSSNSNSLLQAPGKNARGRVPSRRGYPDFDNTRKSNAPPAPADFICQLCLERHTVRTCVENVYASRSRSTIDFDKYERATPHGGPSTRMGPTAQGRSSNPLAPGAVRGRAKLLTNGGRAVRASEYSASTRAPLQALQRVDEYGTSGSTSARPGDAPSDLIGAFNVLSLQIGQAKGSGEYSSLKPTLTSFEVASGSRTVAGPTATKGNLVVPTVNYRKTLIVDVEARTLKPPRLKSATRSLKPRSKGRPQTAN